MSVRIMTQVWELELPDSQKIVMLALADCANDEGMCWPSIATLARKCSKSERTIQSMIRKLEEDGLVTREEVCGKGNRYYLHPRKDCTPANSAPLQGTTTTPAAAAPPPRSRCTQTVKEPSGTVRGGARRARDTGTTLDVDFGSEDWTPPPIADLPDKPRRLVEQWPLGAYQAVCEAFRLVEANAGRAKRGRWQDRLARWLITDHGKVTRDAKAGVDFSTLAPTKAGSAPAEIVSAFAPVPAQAGERPESQAVRDAILGAIGSAQYAQFIRPAAVLQTAPKRFDLIVGGEFQRSWIEQNLWAKISAALARTGTTMAIQVSR